MKNNIENMENKFFSLYIELNKTNGFLKLITVWEIRKGVWGRFVNKNQGKPRIAKVYKKSSLHMIYEEMELNEKIQRGFFAENMKN